MVFNGKALKGKDSVSFRKLLKRRSELKGIFIGHFRVPPGLCTKKKTYDMANCSLRQGDEEVNKRITVSRSSPLGTFREEERLRLSDRNSILMT